MFLIKKKFKILIVYVNIVRKSIVDNFLTRKIRPSVQASTLVLRFFFTSVYQQKASLTCLEEPGSSDNDGRYNVI